MGYPITAAAKTLFANNNRQVARLTFNGLAETLNLTEANIIQGGLSISRYAVTGSTIEVGSCVAGELTLVLDNSTGAFDDTVFEGGEFYVQIGTKNWSNPSEALTLIPMGYFTVDEAPRKLSRITLTALDNMVLFDKTVIWESLTFPMTVQTLLSRICDICNVTCDTTVTSLPNYSYSIAAAPDLGEETTYRQVLSWICEITGTCAYIKWNGHLDLAWYSSTSSLTVTQANRFSSDIYEDAITITGVEIGTDDMIYLAGDSAYALHIESNRLIQDSPSTIASNLNTARGGFSYTPYQASIVPSPYLYPLDCVTFTKSDGTNVTTIVTTTSFKMNGNTAIAAVGETAITKGWAKANPLTKAEQAIIETLRRQQNEALNDQVQTVLEFNKLISNSLGLFNTEVVNEDGSVTYYLHNQATLETSSNIFTLTANGIAWTTTGWNNGSPVWSYGTTAAGNALFKWLSAEGIEVAKAGSDYNIEITPNAFSIYYRDMMVMQIDADELTIPRTYITRFLEIGRIRFLPAYSNNSVVGTDIVMI